MEEIKENIINESNDEQVEDIPLLKPKRKMRKFPRTDKQQEAFTKAMKKRAENVELRKQQKKIEAAKLLLSSENKVEIEQVTVKPKVQKTVKPKKKIILPVSDSELESDDETDDTEEEIYYKPRKSIKAPKKVYILKKEIIEEDSDDEYAQPIIKKNNFKSQKNKKSVIKVTENSYLNPIPKIKNYFCD